MCGWVGGGHLLRFLDPNKAFDFAPSSIDDDDDDELDWTRRQELESATMAAASCVCTAWLVNNTSLLSSTTLGLSFELELELELEPELELE